MVTCVEAASLMHTFKRRLDRAEAFNRKLLKLRDAAKDLESCLDYLAEPEDFLPFEFILGSAAIETARKGISGLWPWLEQCHAYSTQAASRLGATRKVNMDQAAENAAIDYLASAIREVCGDPYYRHVAALAGAVLKTADAVTTDRIRNIIRNRERGLLDVPKTC